MIIIRNYFIDKIEKNQSTKIAFIELNNYIKTSSLTYGEIVKKAKEMSKYLDIHNLQYSVAVVYLPASIDLSVVILACFYSKITLVFKTIYDELDYKKFNYQFNELLNNIKEINLIITDKNRVFIKENCKKNNKNFFCINNYIYNYLKYPPNRDKKLSDFILITSGTSSTFKAIKANINSFKYGLDKSCHKWKVDDSSVTLTWTPHSHIYELINGFLLPMYTGGTSIIVSPKDFANNPVEWLKLINKYKVTNCYTTSYGIDLCNKFYNEYSVDIETVDLNFSSLKYMTISGEFVRNEVLECFDKTYSKFGFCQKSFSPTYGMTENCGFVCSHTENDGPLVVKLNPFFLKYENILEDNTINGVKIVSAGKKERNSHIYIIDENNNILQSEKVGEIVINSFGMPKEYFGLESKESFVKLKCVDDGKIRIFFKTGDYGGFFKEQLLIIGRKKDIINIKGKKYSPYEIEYIAIRYSSYKIKTVIAFSVEIGFNENVVVFVEVNKNDIRNQENIKLEIRKNIKEMLNLDIYDIIIMEFGKIPRTDSKKIKRKECKNLYKTIININL